MRIIVLLVIFLFLTINCTCIANTGEIVNKDETNPANPVKLSNRDDDENFSEPTLDNVRTNPVDKSFHILVATHCFRGHLNPAAGTVHYIFCLYFSQPI